MSSAPIIALLTDFGLEDPYVGVLKAVILGIAPAARLIDLTHAVPPGAVAWGAWQLWSARAYFPRGTVFLAVVDPGVGSRRRAIAVEAQGQYFVGPDNGLLGWAAADSARIVALNRPDWHLPQVSRTFHGRDIFAPIAAHLAAGVAFDELGEALPALMRLDWPTPIQAPGGIRGEVLLWDRFGNLITSLRASELADLNPQALSIEIGGLTIEGLSGCYADVAPGEPLALIGSSGLLEISLRDGDARSRLGATVAQPVFVRAS